MALIEAMRSGSCGVRLVLPQRLRVLRETDDHAELADDDLGARWDLFARNVPLDLSPEHRDELRSAMQAYARDMFEKLYHQFPPSGDHHGPRTDDPDWPALVDFVPTRVGDADALMTVHRMMYDPGREIVLGHLLVPVQDGLFEARVMLRAAETGWRESALMLIDRENGLRDPEVHYFPPQHEYDDPELDDTFPNHVLSRVRHALRWLRDEAGLEVVAPREPVARGEVELELLGCALVPPPRFVATSQLRDAAWFTRTSFSATDGVETFGVVRTKIERSSAAKLREHAVAEARRVLEDNDVRDVHVHVLSAEAASLIVAAEGKGHAGPLRHAFCFVADDADRLWYLCILGIAAISRDVRAAELAAARATLRWLRPSPSAKKWWEIW